MTPKRPLPAALIAAVIGAVVLAGCVPPPTPTPTPPPAVSVASGVFHSCALLENGTVKCWGRNNEVGQLGNGTLTTSSTAVTVTGLTGATAIYAGRDQSCAVLADGTAKCWGKNNFNQLGDVEPSPYSTTPMTVQGVSNIISLAVGTNHTCALVQGGTVKCWGSNQSGELGDGSIYFYSFTPVDVVGVSDAVAIAAGAFHTCALLANGTAKCWGFNDSGGLGIGNTTNTGTPTTVIGLNNATSISASAFTTCARIDDGTARCWGANDKGQLGNGSTSNSSVPVTPSGVSGVSSISPGYDHTCALLDDGTASCWGVPYAVGSPTGPALVPGFEGGTSLESGSHTCGSVDTGRVKCWGYNGFGSLGDGTFTNSTQAVTVIGV
jgi:alpha-tubulin suppressor-like RCC1 family protein